MNNLFSLMLFIFAGASCLAMDSAIDGKLSFDAACSKDQHAHIFVGQKKTLIFDTDVPVGGTFRFHLVPGEYEVRAISESKCHFYQQVQVTVATPNPSVDVKLISGERKPAYWNELGVEPLPLYPNYGFQMPFWGNFGMPIFSNFGWPGAWGGGGGGGIMPSYFAGAGNMAVGKPNLYVSSTKAETVQVAVDYVNKGTRWLATVPAIASEGWKVQLNPGNDMQIEQAKYPYIFYDFRGYDDNMQNTQGFCEPRNTAIDRMISLLIEAKFKSSEIKDFEEYWRVKMPPVEALCVFPQDETQMDKTAKLQVAPQARSIVRRLFVVVPKDKGVFYGKAKFQREPASEWKSGGNTKILNYKSDVDVREWSIGFLFNQ